MNVVHVDSAAGWRGGQNQALLTAAGMAARGHTVVVACRRGGTLERRARVAGLDVAPLPLGGDAAPRAAWMLGALCRRLRADVLHLHDPHALAAGAFAAAARGRVASRRVDFPLRGPLSRWKYRRCARVLAVSRAVAGVLEGGGLEAARVRVVYEGVPDRPPAPGGRIALGELGVPATARVIGNVAALTDHKDHATLLAAAARVLPGRPDTWLLIAGEGERKTLLQEMAREAGIAGRVVFAGFREDLDRLIPAFDVFCLSSHMEGLGTSLLDAMCFARPVVATAAGGIPEAVEDGVTGRVVPVRDAEALAAALSSVLDDRELRARLGAAARARFVERFSADRMVEATLAAYEELA